MSELSPMEQQAQDAMVDILRDVLVDNKKIIRRLQATIVLLIILLVAGFMFYDYSFKAFLSQYDFKTETITQEFDAKADNSATIKDVNQINR